MSNTRRAGEWNEVYGDLGTQPPEQHIPVPLTLLDYWQYPDGRPQPFTPYPDEALRELAKDIEQNGLNHPILVRPMPNGRFQIVSGEHRVKAHKLLSRTVIDATVRQMDDLTAESCMLSSNLQNRRGNKPSDTARIYRALLDVYRRQAGRRGNSPNNSANFSITPGENNSPNNSANYRGDDEAAKTIGVSGDTLRNYIRLLKLLPPLLALVDDGQVPVTAAFELTYLSVADQQRLLELLPEGRKISVSQAKRLRSAAPLTGDMQVLKILGIIKEKKKPRLSLHPRLSGTDEELQALAQDAEFLRRAEEVIEALAREYLKQNYPN